MRIARWIYWVAGIYGLLVLLPQYFLIGRVPPPAVTHEAYYYGFVGVAVVWQIAFLVIGYDPARYRWLMPVTCLEKLVFFVPSMLLRINGRIDDNLFYGSLIDGFLFVCFAIAFFVTPRPGTARTDHA